MSRVLILLALLVAACATPADHALPARPNILLVLVDDLGWQDLSLPMADEPTPFNARYRTPHVERLAAEGLVLTDGYASAPVCTPTRTSLMTGRSPAATGISYWILHHDRDQSAGYGDITAPAWRHEGLQPDDVTLARLLQDAGYRTIHVGKAHLGAKGSPGEDPARLGFDVNIAGHGAGGPGSFLGTQDFSAAHRDGSRVWDVPGLERWHGRDVYLTEALTVEALDAVDAAVADGQPFFLHFAPYAVHAPITANPRHVANYAGLDPREAAYASMVETVDESVGELLARLAAHGIADDTLVVFTSDNGGLSAHGRGGEPHTHNAPLRSGKGSAYEGGVRVPWVVRWPGVVPAGVRSDVPVITHDLFPTLLRVAGAAVPADHVVEGVDLVPLWATAGAAAGAGDDASAPHDANAQAATADRPLFWHMPHFWGVNGPGIAPYSAVRLGHEKLLYWHATGALELYDLDADIGETRDLSAERPERVAALAEELSAWLERTGAAMSLWTESGEPVPLPRHVVGR